MRYSPFRKCVYTLLLCIYANAIYAQTNRYVDPTGSDSGPNDCSNSGTPCQTITHAISQSVANDIINLAAGTYAESVDVNLDLTINGANVGVAASGSRGSESIINPSSNAIAITVTAAGVTIDGIQIGASSSSSNATTGIFDNGNNNIQIDNSIIYANSIGIDIRSITSGTIRINNNLVEMLNIEDQTNPGTGSISMNLYALTGTTDAEVSNNDLQDASWGIFGFNLDNNADHLLIDGGSYSGCTKGIEIDNTDGANFGPSLVDIQNVTMSGFVDPDADVTFPDAQAGIYSFISGSAANTDDITLAISSVDISGVGNTGSDYSAIYMAGFASGGSGIDLDVTVTNSNIHDNLNRGFYIRGATTTANITQCTITGNGFDPTGTGGNPGFSVITRVGAVTTVSNCTIVNASTQTSDMTAGLGSDGGTMTVTDCSITNNGNASGSIATGYSTGTLDISRNWLGSSDETTIGGVITTPADVDFTPWIGSGTDTDGATMGFQPDLSTIYVGTTGTQTGATGRWQEGHNLVDASGTVVLAHADYAETVTVSKNVTFQPTSSGTDTSLDNLVMNATSSVLTLEGNLLIDNAVTLTDGIINVNSGELRLGTSASDLSESAVSRVTGMVTMDPRAVGTGSINLLGVNIAAGASDDIGNVTIIRNSGTSGIVTDGPNSSISAYWDITLGSQPTVAGRDVTFNWRSDFDNGKDMTMMSVFRNTGAGWTEMAGPVDVSGSNPRSFTVNAVTQFSLWTLAQDDEPLPVELSAFSAEIEGNNVMFNWETMTEVNSDRFEIESSLDGSEFEKIGEVDAAGHSTEAIKYNWSYATQFKDYPIYFRLKMIDVDETFEYSRTIVVHPEYVDEIKIFPNPSNGVIRFTNLDSNRELKIFDFKGRIIKSGFLGESILDVSDLEDGMYLIQLQGQKRVPILIRK